MSSQNMGLHEIFKYLQWTIRFIK